MATQVSDALVLVNNSPVGIIPNSLTYDEGLGEQNMRVASLGGGQTDSIYSNNIELSFSKIMFEIPVTVQNIALARAWKVNRNNNVVQIVSQTPDGKLTKTFTQAALLNNYEVPLGAETNIALEFTSKPAA